MEKELIKTLSDLFSEFVQYRYEQAGRITNCGGNWSGNRDIVKNTSFEDFSRWLKSRESID